MEDNLSKLEKLLEMMDTKSSMDDFLQAFELVVSFVEQIKTGNEEERQQINEKVDKVIAAAIEDGKNKILDIIKQEWARVKAQTDQLKDGKDGGIGPEGPQGPQGIPGIAGKDGLTGNPGKDGSPDTPDEIITKVNAAEKLINPERIKGLGDIERIAKANAFNPAMGPSFSDLKRLQDQITGIGGTNQGGKVSINYIIDGGGSALTTGVKGYIEIPYAMTITGWQIFADQSGSVVVDVWKSTYANFPPLVGGTITGSEKPTLSSAQRNQNLSLSTWNASLTAGDILAYNVDSISSITRVTVSIIGIKT